MAQPTGQVLLNAASPYYGYFWYANGSGLWDARNGAMATKTGTGAVTATGEGGANVATSTGTTYYSSGALTTLGDPCTVGFKVKRSSATGDKGMVIGNRATTDTYFWIRASEIRAFGLTTANSNPDSWATFHYVRLADGTGKVYKNGAFVGNVAWNGPRTINSIMDGYSGGSFALDGALEYMHVIPGLAADATQVASLYADPYQALVATGASAQITATTANTTGFGSASVSPKSAILATTANATGSGSASTGAASASVASTTASATFSGSATGSTSNGTFTSEVLKDNAGNVLASKALNFVSIYNDTTGALVLRKTGISTNGSGVFSFSDAALTAGVTYRVDWETSDNHRRMPRKAAA